MCGRFTLTTDLDRLAERFAFRVADLSYRPRYNIAPSQSVLALVNDDEKLGTHGVFLRWGLIPSWAKDAAIGNRMINARAETVAEKPSFRRALQKRRCLILADGFYEWRQDGRAKTPLFIHLQSRAPFALAGLWEQWHSPTGETLRSCTIITTAANAFMEPIHARMPVLLPPDAERLWLDPASQEPHKLTPFLRPYAAEDMAAYAVSSIVNSPKNDSPECLRPLPEH